MDDFFSPLVVDFECLICARGFWGTELPGGFGDCIREGPAGRRLTRLAPMKGAQWVPPAACPPGPPPRLPHPGPPEPPQAGQHRHLREWSEGAPLGTVSTAQTVDLKWWSPRSRLHTHTLAHAHALKPPSPVVMGFVSVAATGQRL